MPRRSPRGGAGRPIEHERRCHECCEEVADTVIDALKDLRPELVVLGTHGLASLVHGSVSETIARNVAVPALFVPNHGRGFVGAATGAIDLSRILISARTVAEAQRGIDAARRLAALAGKPDAKLEIVHVGAPDPELAKLGVTVTRVEATLEDAILAVAREHEACVIEPLRAGQPALVQGWAVAGDPGVDEARARRSCSSTRGSRVLRRPGQADHHRQRGARDHAER